MVSSPESYATHSLSSSISTSSASIEGDHLPFKPTTASLKRQSGTTLVYEIPGNETNTDFRNHFCAAIYNGLINVTIRNSGSDQYYVPTCLGVPQVTSIKSVTLHGRLVLDTWGALPRSLTRFFSLYSEFIRPAGVDSYPGYLADGSIDWSGIWTQLPDLAFFSVQAPTAWRGSLPNEIPAKLRSFSLIQAPVGGSIPSGIFRSVGPVNGSEFTFAVHGASLNGSIPSDLFTPFENTTSNFTQFAFSVTNNSLSGPIPNSLLAPFEAFGAGIFIVDLSMNDLDGSISGINFPSRILNTTGILTVHLHQNHLVGPFTNIFAALRGLSAFNFRADSNRIDGVLPLNLFPAGLLVSTVSRFEFQLQNNLLSGPLPPLFPQVSSNTSCYTLLINLDNNMLSGPISRTLLVDPASPNSVSSRSLQLNLMRNHLNGTIENGVLDKVIPAPTATSFLVALASNRLTGTFPDRFFKVPSDLTAISFTLDASENHFYGSLPDLCVGTNYLTINMDDNRLNGTIPGHYGEPSTCAPVSIDLDKNYELHGTLPSFILQMPSISTFRASATSLSGALPQVGSALRNLDLSQTGLDFCSSSSSNNSLGSVLNCKLMCSRASQCSSDYLGCDTTPTTCVEIPPIPQPMAPQGCASATRPSPDFECINGIWVAKQVTTITLVIPSGAGSVVINGTVTSSSLVFYGIGSSVTVDGCATNLSQIVVRLSAADLDRIGKSKPTLQQLLVLSGSNDSSTANCTNINNIGLSTIVSEGSCKKIETRKAVSGDGKTFGAYFTVDSSGCNRWWIILVSVVCAVVVIGVGVGIVAYVVWKHHRVGKFKDLVSSSKQG